MDEILIEGRVFISSKQAAKITGYAKDYVGQLCREGRVDARLVGRNWYVLQDSIREHRFGKPEEALDASHAETLTLEDRASSWQRPQYQAETPAFVADLAPKAPAAPLVTPNPAIQDMQSAWKEWFEERKPMPAPMRAESNDQESERLPEMSAEETVEEVFEEEVLISRVPQEDVYETLEPEEEESEVELHRSYGPRRTGERMQVNSVPVADISSKAFQKRSVVSETHPTDSHAGSGVIRAVIVVIAVAAVLVAIVGTGNADRLLAGTSFDFGAQKSVIDFLGGKSTYESSL